MKVRIFSARAAPSGPFVNVSQLISIDIAGNRVLGDELLIWRRACVRSESGNRLPGLRHTTGPRPTTIVRTLQYPSLASSYDSFYANDCYLAAMCTTCVQT